MALPDNLPQNSYIKLWWRIDETSGTNIVDSSGNSHAGTASRTQILASTAGKIAYCGTFVATSSDKITIADHADLQPTKIFSLACWVKTTQAATYIGIIDKYTGSAAGYMLDIPANDGKPRFVIFDTANRTTQATAAINGGTWQHVCGVYDGSNVIIYVNGSASGTPTAATGNLTNDTHVFAVGGDGASTNYFTGDIDEVILWNGVALSAAEVAQVNAITAYNYNQVPVGALTLTGNIGKAITKKITGISTFIGSIIKERIVPILVQGILTFGGSAAQNFYQTVVGIITFAGTIKKNITKTATGIITFTGSILKQIVKTITGIFTITGNILKQTGKFPTGIITFLGNITNKATGKFPTGILVLSGTIGKAISVTRTGIIAFTGLVNKGINQVVTGIITFTGDILKAVTKTVIGSITFAGSIIKSIGKNITGSIIFTAILTVAGNFKRTITGAIIFTGSVAKAMAVTAMGEIRFTGRAIKGMFKTLSGVLTMRGWVRRAGWNRLQRDSETWTIETKDSETWSATTKDTEVWTPDAKDTETWT